MNILEQGLINKLNTHRIERRARQDDNYDRLLHNQQLEDLIDELSEDLDE